jgi:acetyl/propionyl-CoA carboxylase alpha subunit
MTALILGLLSPAVMFGQESERPAVDYSKSAYDTIAVSMGVSKLGENSLPRYHDQEEIHKNVSAAMKGLRIFSLEINPGEKVKITLKCMPSTAIKINWNIPAADDPYVAEIKKLHFSQQKINSPVIEFKNKLGRRYFMSFFLQGSYDIPYTVTIDRK